jgi:hypothetical protein
MPSVSLKCTCGAVRGRATGVGSGSGLRVVCMCRDCQAYARHLGRQNEILDRNGGTDIFQLTPSQLSIRQGSEKIACVKLSPRGILRWYTRCCRTPIGNTLSTSQVPFVGVPHLFMDHAYDGVTRDAALGLVSAYVHAQSGYGDIPAGAYQTASWDLILRTLGRLVAQRVTGKHAPSPFFDERSGKPICDPLVLTAAERMAL